MFFHILFHNNSKISYFNNIKIRCMILISMRGAEGLTKTLIKYYLLDYGKKTKKDIRMFLQDRTNIPFKTNEAIDRHLRSLISSSDVREIEIDNTYYQMTEQGKMRMYEDMEKEILKREIEDWEFHKKMEDNLLYINNKVIQTIIAVKEKGYFRPF